MKIIVKTLSSCSRQELDEFQRREKKSSKNIIGPAVYENWMKWNKDHKDWIACEYPLFTDAHITGDLSDLPGPYQFINLVPSSLGECLAPTVMLRIAKPQGMGDIPSMKQTDDSRFHGGKIVDEIAALLSLQMGIRFKTGKLTRCFLPGADPKGRPRAFEMLPDLVTPRYLPRPVVPSARGAHSLNQSGLFSHLLELRPAEAITLVRAARMYQDAIWICESQPALAWVLLVCAVETAANHWREGDENPVKRLEASSVSGMIHILEEAGGKKLVKKIAGIIAPYLGATRKFIDFVMTFLPEPPDKRPPKYAQLNWNTSNMKKALRKIYGYRSKTLHGGTPFPAPMCDPPGKHGNEPAEIPMGSTRSAHGGVWVAADIPMLLWVFEYIARNALINWWRLMLKNKARFCHNSP